MAERREAREAAHRHRAKIPRAPVVVAVGLVVLGGILVGHHGHAAASGSVRLDSGPVAAPAAALSSSWFCAGATDDAHGDASGQLVIANAGDTGLSADVTLLPSRGTSRSLTVTVGPDSRASVPETVKGGAPWIGASVTLDRGEASVEQQVSGPLGEAATPCATEGASTWYFANGATLVNASSEITLLNPYPGTATVDLTFTTNEGVEQPEAFQAIVVPSGSLVAVDLGSQLQRRSFIATTIKTTAGRVVAWKTDAVTPPAAGAPILGTKAASAPDADPASPDLGVTLTLGSPVLSTSWMWPEGISEDGVDEQYVIYNPGDRTSKVSLAVRLDQGSAEPFDLTVGPGEVSSLAMASEARIPSGVGYSVRLHSTNGVPVVAERTLTEAAPAAARGIAELIGASAPARWWLVGAGDVGPRIDEELAVSNPGSSTVTLAVEALDGGHLRTLPGLAAVRVAAGRRLEVDLGRLGKRFGDAVVVSASAPVVVGRDLTGRDGDRGVSSSLGVPLTGPPPR